MTSRILERGGKAELTVKKLIIILSGKKLLFDTKCFDEIIYMIKLLYKRFYTNFSRFYLGS